MGGLDRPPRTYLDKKNPYKRSRHRTSTEIGKERGWSPATWAQFDALRGSTGALLFCAARTVAQKVLYVNEVLGGLSRITSRWVSQRCHIRRCCGPSNYWGPTSLL